MKTRQSFVCGFLAAIFMLAFAACDDGNGKTHTHSYSTTWSKDATQHWHECSCGNKTEVANHIDGDWIVDQAATATTAGSKHKVCTVCGYETAREAIPATGEGNGEYPIITIKSIVISTDEDGELANNANVEGVIGGELQFYAELVTDPVDAGDAEHAVTWSVSGGSGDSYIEDDGLLHIDEHEVASPASYNQYTWLTVTATSVIDSKKVATARVKMVARVIPTYTLTVGSVPAGAATVNIRRGTGVATIVNGREVQEGTSVGIYYIQNTTQRANYAFVGISASPKIEFGGEDGSTSAKRWLFDMPSVDTVITIEFTPVDNTENAILSWTVTDGG